MNPFLFALVLGLGAAGLYEYTTFQHENAADRQQLTDLDGKLGAIQSANKKLEDDQTQLMQNARDAQSEIAGLGGQVQAARDALAKAEEEALAAAKARAAAAALAALPPPDPNDLGTITTLGGQTFQNCHLLNVDADGITINHTQGITKILFGLLPPDLQKRFGYDPHQAATSTKAQIQLQEEQEKAPAPAPGDGN